MMCCSLYNSVFKSCMIISRINVQLAFYFLSTVKVFYTNFTSVLQHQMSTPFFLIKCKHLINNLPGGTIIFYFIAYSRNEV